MAETTQTGTTALLRNWALSNLTETLAADDAALKGNADFLAAAETDYNAIHGENAWARHVEETRRDLQADAEGGWDFWDNDEERLAAFDPAQLLVNWVREDYSYEQSNAEAITQSYQNYSPEIQELLANGNSEDLMAAALHHAVYASRGAIALQNMQDGQMTEEGVARIREELERSQNLSAVLWDQAARRMDASPAVKQLMMGNQSMQLVLNAENLAEEDGTLTTEDIQRLGTMSAIYSRLEGAAASGYAENLTADIEAQLMPPEGQRSAEQEALLTTIQTMEDFIKTIPDDPEELIESSEDFAQRQEMRTFYEQVGQNPEIGLTLDGTIFTQASRPTEEELAGTESFQAAAAVLFEREYGMTFEEADASDGVVDGKYDADGFLPNFSHNTLGEWGIQYISKKNNQLWEAGEDLTSMLITNGYTDREKVALLYGMQTFDLTRSNFGTAARALGYSLTDPVSLATYAAAIPTLGGSIAAAQGAKLAGQRAVMSYVTSLTTRVIVGAELASGAVDGAMRPGISMGLEEQTGQAEYEWTDYVAPVVIGAGAGATVDAVIGVGAGTIISGVADMVTPAPRVRVDTPDAIDAAPALTDAPANINAAPVAEEDAPIAPVTFAETAPEITTPDAPIIADEPANIDAPPVVDTTATVTPITPRVTPVLPSAPTLGLRRPGQIDIAASPNWELGRPDVTRAPAGEGTPGGVTDILTTTYNMLRDGTFQPQWWTNNQGISIVSQAIEKHGNLPEGADWRTHEIVTRLRETLDPASPEYARLLPPGQTAPAAVVTPTIDAAPPAQPVTPVAADAAPVIETPVTPVEVAAAPATPVEPAIDAAPVVDATTPAATVTPITPAAATTPAPAATPGAPRRPGGWGTMDEVARAAHIEKLMIQNPERAFAFMHTRLDAGEFAPIFENLKPGTQASYLSRMGAENPELHRILFGNLPAERQVEVARLMNTMPAPAPVAAATPAPAAATSTATPDPNAAPDASANAADAPENTVPDATTHAGDGTTSLKKPKQTPLDDKAKADLFKHPNRIKMIHVDSITTADLNNLTTKQISKIPPHVLRHLSEEGKFEGLKPELKAKADISISWLTRGDVSAIPQNASKDNAWITTFYGNSDYPDWQQIYAQAALDDFKSGRDVRPYGKDLTRASGIIEMATRTGMGANESIVIRELKPFLNIKNHIDALVASGKPMAEAKKETADMLLKTLASMQRYGRISNVEAVDLLIRARIGGLRLELTELTNRSGLPVPYSFDDNFYYTIVRPVVAFRKETTKSQDDQALFNYRKIANLGNEDMGWGFVAGRITQTLETQEGGFNPYRQNFVLRILGDLTGGRHKADASGKVTYGHDWKSPFRALNYVFGRLPSFGLIHHADQGYHANLIEGGLKYPIKALGAAVWLGNAFLIQEGVEAITGQELTIFGEEVSVAGDTLDFGLDIAGTAIDTVAALPTAGINYAFGTDIPYYNLNRWGFGVPGWMGIGVDPAAATPPAPDADADAAAAGTDPAATGANTGAADPLALPSSVAAAPPAGTTDPAATGGQDPAIPSGAATDPAATGTGTGTGTPPADPAVTGAGAATGTPPAAPPQRRTAPEMDTQDFIDMLPSAFRNAVEDPSVRDTVGNTLGGIGRFAKNGANFASQMYQVMADPNGPLGKWGPIAGIAALGLGGLLGFKLLRNGFGFLTSGKTWMTLGGLAVGAFLLNMAVDKFNGDNEAPGRDPQDNRNYSPVRNGGYLDSTIQRHGPDSEEHSLLQGDNMDAVPTDLASVGPALVPASNTLAFSLAAAPATSTVTTLRYTTNDGIPGMGMIGPHGGWMDVAGLTGAMTSPDITLAAGQGSVQPPAIMASLGAFTVHTGADDAVPAALRVDNNAGVDLMPHLATADASLIAANANTGTLAPNRPISFGQLTA